MSVNKDIAEAARGLADQFHFAGEFLHDDLQAEVAALLIAERERCLAILAAAPEMIDALRDGAEILFHLGTAGKNTSQDEAIEAVRERMLAAISKAGIRA